ncbi:HAD family hydrolase [Micromonospora siamensis]|uniref:Haloacid dehalogenase superfamily, subfamily IA, variant 1 with third motif having Dx(3-4)D or Dx(3-4)E n=1 Tax=Micromonospora siamensis TaxID=299152 RepID=A0A1C5I9K1_9ACTN|nr:HAD family hydrolase [Micromonospora siamensis]SCG54825.1 Haloacid dehalogenase superfamily, subfamily IA, variant 2 with 3rd motif like haloacid dehalogenase/haloacid dehalogenase superfamily, subfamily IA, variant 3 with third motif having DD or ED/haloacid dehalogenase superfamily, subfamily IA, variant 1 with third motif having Dx(3-4)D or Dx(3-4)E [Micromonospora siamensis]
MVEFRAVAFDWRGTLVTTLSMQEWVRTALRRLGRDTRPVVVAQVAAAIDAAAGEPDRLDPPGLDCDAAFHRETYHRVLADAGLDDALVGALYAVESDATQNPFAVDVDPVLRAIAGHGLRIAVVSDIHFDVRPAFAAAGLADLVSTFVLSHEHGVQKPDPRIYRLTLDRLGTVPGQTLMVGDRQGHDGAAVEVGMPTLLLPPLTGVRDERLGLAARLLGVRTDPPARGPAGPW